MLAGVVCDAIAIGDYFTKRGRLIISALFQDKHIIGDKPVCTCLDELNEIESYRPIKEVKLAVD